MVFWSFGVRFVKYCDRGCGRGLELVVGGFFEKCVVDR